MTSLVNIVCLHMIFVMSSPQITFVADIAGVLSETFLPISLIVKEFHVPLVENSPSELLIANAALVSLFHVRFDVACSCR